MNLEHLDVTLHGQKFRMLAGKPTGIPNRRLCLLKNLDKKRDYSLWLVETEEDEGSLAFWPYEGPEEEENSLIMELEQYFINHAFD